MNKWDAFYVRPISCILSVNEYLQKYSSHILKSNEKVTKILRNTENDHFRQKVFHIYPVEKAVETVYNGVYISTAVIYGEIRKIC